MINYDVVDTRIHHVYNGLKVQVNCTSELNNQQAFFMNKLKSSDTYKNMDILDIYKKEYERIDKITEEHVKRGVRDIQKVFTNLGLGQDYIELAKSAHELHDVARRVQFMKTGTVVDADSYDQQVIASRGLESGVDPKITSHAAHGAYLLDNFLFSNLHIEEKYREIISTAVRYHSNHVLPVELGKAVSENLFDGLCLDEALKKEKYNDLLRLYTQTVRSVDNFDLNNKVLLGAIPLVRERFGLDVLKEDSIKTFANLWGVSEKRLREYNKIEEGKELEAGQIILIPTEDVPLEKFVIPKDYIEMLKNNTFPAKVSDLQKRKDYTFLTAQVWRLSLLRNIEFKSLLKIVKDENMLEKILDSYPKKYQEIMQEAFKYAEEEIVCFGLENEKSKIYTKK